MSILSPSSPPDDVNRSASRTTNIRPTPFFQFLSKSGDGRLLRTCRLVCRDWARLCPPVTFSDLTRVRSSQCALELCDFEIEGALADCWVVMLAPYLPKSMWAWVFQRASNGEHWTKKVEYFVVDSHARLIRPLALTVYDHLCSLDRDPQQLLKGGPACIGIF